MKLKKVLSVLGLTVVLMLAGCGASGSSDGNEGADIQKIKDAGVLKVGVKVDVPKFGYKDPATEKNEGMEVDIAKALAKEILGDESKVQFQGVTAKTRGPLLDNGELDMVIATFTITPERKESYNFSQPYFTDGVGLLVKKDSGINGLADLNGKTVGVAQSATTKKSLEDAAKEANITLKFSEFASYPEIKAALDSGRVNAFSVDSAILNGYVDDSTVILSDRFTPQEYGVATKKANTDLAKLVDDKIGQMKSNGELNALIDKWEIK